MKILVGKDIGAYDFVPGVAGVGTITFSDLGTVNTDDLGIITETESNTIIYQFNKPDKGGNVVANVLTLDFDTTGMVAGSEGLRINIQIGDPSTDFDIGAQRTINLNPEYANYSDGYDLTPSPQIVDTSLTKFGQEIDVREYKTANLSMFFDSGNTLNGELHIVSLEYVGGPEAEFIAKPFLTIWTNELDVDSISLPLDVAPYQFLQLYVKTGTVGVLDATISGTVRRGGL